LDDLSSAFQAILSGTAGGIGKKSSNSSRNSSRKSGVSGSHYLADSVGASSAGNALAAVTIPSMSGGSEYCQSDNSVIDDRSSERYAARSSGANSSNVDRVRSRSEESLLEPGSCGGGGSSSCRSDKLLLSFNSDRKSMPKISGDASGGGGSMSSANSLSQHHKQLGSGGGMLSLNASGGGGGSRASSSTSPRPPSSRILGSRYDLLSARRRFPSAHELRSAHQQLWVKLWVDVWVDDECNNSICN